MRGSARRALGGLALLLLMGSAARLPARPEAAGPVTLTPVKYADLGKAIRAQKGKVVVVEFWAFY